MFDWIARVFGEEIDLADTLPLDPVFPEIEWIGVSDVVVVYAKTGDFLGTVIDTDPAENMALVRVWDYEAGVWYTAWWTLDFIELAANAEASAA